MSRKSTFSHYSLDFDSHKTFSIGGFKGVDFSPAQLNVDKYHAVESKNIIFRDDVNQKRYGYEQMAKVLPYSYYINDGGTYVQKTNSTNINGIWKYVGEDNKYHTVLHIGNILFVASRLGKSYSFLDLKLTPIVSNTIVNTTTYNLATEIGDNKSTAFVQNKRLYILTGNKLYVIKVLNKKLAIFEVEDDEDTYIPKTTTSITYADSAVKSSVPLDDVNLMQSFRKNGLVSGTYFDDGVTVRTTRFWDWQLDSSVVPKKSTDINKIKISINSLREVE